MHLGVTAANAYQQTATVIHRRDIRPIAKSVLVNTLTPLSIPRSPQPLPRNIRNRNQKFDKNITKRGNVDIGVAEKRQEETPVSQKLIIFFMVVIVGSSLVQIFNLFGGSASKPPVE